MEITLAFVDGTPSSLIAFVAICVGIMIAFLSAVGLTARSRSESRRLILYWTVGLACYITSIACLVYSGLLERAFIPFGPLFLVIAVALAIAVGFTQIGTQIAHVVPIAWLVLFQGFRLPLELVLHEWVTMRLVTVNIAQDE